MQSRVESVSRVVEYTTLHYTTLLYHHTHSFMYFISRITHPHTGVVDSEDVPLNLSREHLQDSQLIRRVSNVITKRILKSLADEAATDRGKFETFYKEFGGFLKEGE